MVFKWVKANFDVFRIKHRESITIAWRGLYFIYSIIICALWLVGVMERNGKFNIKETDDWLNNVIRSISLISGDLILITIILPMSAYLIYRLYKLLRHIYSNYKQFVENGGSLKKTEDFPDYDPYRKS